MSNSAKLSLVAQFSGALTNILSSGETARPTVNHENKQALELLNGVSADQVDFVIGKNDLSILTASPLTLDLFDFAGFDIGAGAGLDALGQPIQLTKLVALMIVNKSETSALDVGGDNTAGAFKALFAGSAATPEAAALRIQPKGFALLAAPDLAGYPIVDATDHLLKLAAATADLECALLIAGRTS